MKEKIKKLKEKFCTKEFLLYLVFGTITTLVNWGTFSLLHNVLNCDKNIANVIAIICAVTVAFFTNKYIVFRSKTKGIKEKSVEFGRYIIGRAFTMTLEFVLDALLFLTPIPENVVKIVITVFIVILNYFVSKYFAFRKGKKKNEEITKKEK